MNLIEINNLSFSYEKSLILQNITLNIKKGEFLAIFGPNGGGKTTLLKLLLGFLFPSEGTIRMHSDKIGYVPQVARFDREFPVSVLDIILMGFLSELTLWGRYPKCALEKAKTALHLVGLEGIEKQPFGTLSGGQAQRVLIARAIANACDLLILDEPTANIDPEAEAAIYRLLDNLRNSMTILLVTHDLQGVVEKADRLLSIHRTARFYSPKEVCRHFSFGLIHPNTTSEE